MYLVMNVVHVKEERREAFERAFLERESHVHKAEGFAGFEVVAARSRRRVRRAQPLGDQGCVPGLGQQRPVQNEPSSCRWRAAHGSEVRNYDDRRPSPGVKERPNRELDHFWWL